MTTLIITGILLTSLLAFMAYIAIWSRRPTHARLLAVLLIIPLSLVSFVSIAVNLGSPSKCIAGYTIPADQSVNVLGYRIDKDVNITLMLDLPSGVFLCTMPYSPQAASDLQEAERQDKVSFVKGHGQNVKDAANGEGGLTIDVRGPEAEVLSKPDSGPVTNLN